MNMLNKSQDFDSYEVEEPSDEERAASSSEDELDVLLNGTAEQKKKLIREYLTGESELSSEDDFEKEMETELSSTIRNMEGTWAPAANSGGEGAGAGGVGGSSVPSPPMYDKVYFDSDSEDEDTPSSSTSWKRRQRVVPTNDELLYDPDEDDRDQAWVDARRYNSRKQPNAASRSKSGQPRRLPNSDAVLNCPACMTTLCLDCQRHEKYRTQYRAMFVMNCTVKRDEVLRYKTEQLRKQRKRKRGQKVEPPADAPTNSTDPDEVYHPVTCSECSTEVAVIDEDDVYHFFNILASHC
uniref:E2f-associated phosphoprotein n=1 Tax=Nothobranchius korthausae TaxID=1143690 RepID=A0A1A8GT97_9TELE